jgi:hypothetical protein
MMTDFNFDKHYSELMTQEIAAADEERLKLIVARCLESAAMAMVIAGAGNDLKVEGMLRAARIELVRKAAHFAENNKGTLRPVKAA